MELGVTHTVSHTVSHAVSRVFETLQSNIWWYHDCLGGSSQCGGKTERSHHDGDHVRADSMWDLQDPDRLLFVFVGKKFEVVVEEQKSRGVYSCYGGL